MSFCCTTRDFHIRRWRSARCARFRRASHRVRQAAAPGARPRTTLSSDSSTDLSFAFLVLCSFRFPARTCPKAPMNRRSGRSPLVLQVFQQMLCVHSGCDEFRSAASHLRQKLFSALIDEGDITQIHDSVRIGCGLATVLPTRAQLRNPWTRQLSAQRPPLFCFCSRVCDPQHGDSDSSRSEMHAARQFDAPDRQLVDVRNGLTDSRAEAAAPMTRVRFAAGISALDSKRRCGKCECRASAFAIAVWSA